MPEQVRCPSCNAALRVPDNLLGRNVKCPKCQTTFVAEAEESAPREEVVREPRSAARRRPRPEEIEEEDELPPEEELEEEPEEEYEERPRRRRRGGRRRAAAESMVATPAICLIVTGGLGILSAIIFLVFELKFNPYMNQSAPVPVARSNDPAFEAGYMAGQRIGKASVYGGGVFGVIWGILLLVGGLSMKQLKNYGLVMTTSVFALLPCNCCCLMGLPIGIWALTVLSKPEVKSSFS